MELVEGDDLSQRIARGVIPLDDALPIAKQIAEALEAAHEQGIVHRDLKPGNIKVRADGTVKVLDFGLAKAIEPVGAASASASMSPTLSLHATQAGMILGTAAYMAPEQARGRPVDKRADIWAFGCVLYEMIAGKPAFAGDTITDVLAEVVTKEPDWSALPAGTPRSVQRYSRAACRRIRSSVCMTSRMRDWSSRWATPPSRPVRQRQVRRAHTSGGRFSLHSPRRRWAPGPAWDGAHPARRRPRNGRRTVLAAPRSR
jgi:serine/threonine protein kinase